MNILCKGVTRSIKIQVACYSFLMKRRDFSCTRMLRSFNGIVSYPQIFVIVRRFISVLFSVCCICRLITAYRDERVDACRPITMHREDSLRISAVSAVWVWYCAGVRLLKSHCSNATRHNARLTSSLMPKGTAQIDMDGHHPLITLCSCDRDKLDNSTSSAMSHKLLRDSYSELSFLRLERVLLNPIPLLDIKLDHHDISSQLGSHSGSTIYVHYGGAGWPHRRRRITRYLVREYVDLLFFSVSFG